MIKFLKRLLKLEIQLTFWSWLPNITTIIFFVFAVNFFPAYMISLTIVFWIAMILLAYFLWPPVK